MTLSARRNCGWNEVAASEWSEETSENDRATPLARNQLRTCFGTEAIKVVVKVSILRSFVVPWPRDVPNACCVAFEVKESKAQSAPFQLVCISYISYCMASPASLCCPRTNSGGRVGVQQRSAMKRI